MFNKKRVFVFAVFCLFLFFMMTFGSGSRETVKVNTRTVEFIDGLTNETISIQNVEVGHDANVPETPNHEGCDFSGWFTENDVEVNAFTNVTEDLTVYAECDWQYFTVTFYDTVGRRVIDTQSVRYGLDAVAPRVPVHTNYSFDRWSRGYTNVTSNFQVDALYTSTVFTEYYDVVFIDNDTNEQIDSQSVREGSNAVFPEIPVHKNRVYDRYEGEYTNVTEDRVVTLYFKDAEKFNVTFNKGEHGKLNKTEDSVVFNVFVNNTFSEGNVLTPTVTPNEGYNFVKWDTDFSDETVVNKNITITALYEAENVTYDVRYLEVGTEKVLSVAKNINGKYDETVTETALDITGYNLVGKEVQKLKLGLTGNVITFYYEAKDVTYNVNYLEQNTNAVLHDPLLNQAGKFKAQATATAEEITGYNLVGEATKSIELGLTDNNINFYYTARKDLSYTVEYRLNSVTGAMLQYKVVSYVTYKQTYTESPIDIEGYIKPTEDKSITINSLTNNKIIFVYTAKDVTYDIRYLEQGTNKVLAPARTGIPNKYNVTISAEAPEITGYNLIGDKLQSLKLELTGNVITFYYEAADVKYSVHYLEAGTEKPLLSSKTVLEKKYNETVSETAQKITGYNLVGEATKSLTLGLTGNNIIFYYAARKDLSYTVEYRLGTVSGTKLADDKEVSNVTFKQTYTESPIDIEGYVRPTENKSVTINSVTENKIVFIYTARTDLSYTVEYRLDTVTGTKLADDKEVTNVTYKETYTESPIDIKGYVRPTENKSVTINKLTGNVITFVYTAKDVTYDVRYLETGTNKVLADAKSNVAGKFNETVSEKAKDVTGYDLVSDETQTLKLGLSGNVITFYYEAKDVTYDVRYLEQGTNKVLETAKTGVAGKYNETVSEKAADIIGYDLVSDETQSLKLGLTGNVITFYYTASDVTYNVNYLEQTTNAVLHDPLLNQAGKFKAQATATAEEITGYNLVGEVTKSIELGLTDNNINFYYTARTDLSYTVEYRLDTVAGTKLSKDKEVSNVTYKETYTESPIDITGYIAPTEDKSITINKLTGNVITFVYTAKDVTYNVRYLETGTNKVLADAKSNVAGKYNETVSEKAKDVTGYDLVSDETQTLTLGLSGNVITFYYEAKDVTYDVRYLETGTNKVLADAKSNVTGKYNETVSEKAKDVTGYDLVSDETQTLKLGLTGNVITFYYEAKDVTYDVRYLETGTDKVLATAKTGVAGKYNETVSETAVDVTGYNVVGNKIQTLTLGLTGNVITFYYDIKSLDYTVNYYFDTIKNDEMTVKAKADFNTIINASDYMNLVEGYKTPTSSVESITVGEDTTKNVIDIFYIKKSPIINATVSKELERNGETVGETEPAKYGDVITYTVTIKNTGDADGIITLRDLKFALEINDTVEIITEGLSTNDINTINSLLSNDGLTVKVSAEGEYVISFNVRVIGNAGESINTETTYKVGEGIETSLGENTFLVEKDIKYTEKTETIYGTNIVVVLDKSSSMDDNDKIIKARNAANSFIDDIFTSTSNSNGSVVSVVTFSTNPDCKMTWGGRVCDHVPYADIIGSANDYASAATLKSQVSAISKSGDSHGTPYYIGLQQAYNVLYNSTNGLSNNGNKNVVVFLTDGQPDSTDNATQRNTYINLLHSKGTTVYAIGYDGTSNNIINSIAGDSSRVFTAGINDLIRVFDAINEDIKENDPVTSTTSKGVAEISNTIIADETHKVTIKVNGTVTKEYTSIASMTADKLIIFDSVKNCYEVDATKFAAADSIEVTYFVSIDSASNEKSSKSALRMTLYGMRVTEEIPQMEEEVITEELESAPIEVLDKHLNTSIIEQIIPEEKSEEVIIEPLETEEAVVTTEEITETDEDKENDSTNSLEEVKTTIEENKELEIVEETEGLTE